MSGPAPEQRKEMSDDELRAWALKRGRIAAVGWVLLAVVLGVLALSFLR